MAANKVERLSPRYVAFRTMQNWIAVPVIARIESHRSGRVVGILVQQAHTGRPLQRGARRACRCAGKR